jgi:hypothetical protein
MVRRLGCYIFRIFRKCLITLDVILFDFVFACLFPFYKLFKRMLSHTSNNLYLLLVVNLLPWKLKPEMGTYVSDFDFLRFSVETKVNSESTANPCVPFKQLPCAVS